MKIGIDIDDTITDTRSCVFKYKKIAYPDRNPFEMLPSDLLKNFMAKYELKIHENVTLKDNVVANIKKLAQDNEITIITSRGMASEEITCKYLKKQQIPYHQIYFNVSNKGHKAKELGLDLFIDDHDFICQQMQDVGIEVIKMHRNDEEYEYLEFDNWNDITNYILNKKGGEEWKE